jgi:4,5-DOPA dioxygenase extradiol
MTKLMPVVFIGHGNPLNALSNNIYTQGWAALGRSIPRPRAVLAVSAHWFISKTALTSNTTPPTIHDFGGFPEELYRMQYPAPGDPELARHVLDFLPPGSASLDDGWGLDHGTWAVLCHVFPKADIPVVQLSIDESQPPLFHYELGKKLKGLREEGILVVGSGNIVHNLTAYAWGNHRRQAYDWARRFEEQARKRLVQGDDGPLVDYQNLGDDALLSIPTPEHYLPLLYVLGLRDQKDSVSFPVEGVDGGSVSMLAVRLG